MSSANSINLDSMAYPKPQKKEVGGLKYTMTMSPYFKPEKVKYSADDNKQVVIRFVYLDREDDLPIDEDFDEFDLWLGERTAKLQKIQITFNCNSDEIDRPSDFEAQIVEAVRNATSLAIEASPSMQDNYELIREIIGRHAKEIVRSIFPTITKLISNSLVDTPPSRLT